MLCENYFLLVLQNDQRKFLKNLAKKVFTKQDCNGKLEIASENKIHLYTYDASGERIIKSSGDSQNVTINGSSAATLVHTDNYIGYVSPYFVISKGKFTKHYFEGTRRITSKLGQGTFAQPLGITAGGINYGKLSAQEQVALDAYVKLWACHRGHPHR